MSMLSSQADELRLQKVYGQAHGQGECENGGERESCGPLDVLLRCLENDYGIRASWDGLRRVWTTESVTAELDYVEDKSRWHEMFGTPERAARTLKHVLDCKDFRLEASCNSCPIFGGCTDRDASDDALLEWLRGDA